MRRRTTIFTLDIDTYAPEITALTFPLMRYYARKIGAELVVIRERKFPTWPIAVEKFQVYDLARRAECEWAIFFDADTLIHPETIDFTSYIPRDMVAHNGQDMAGVRWRPHPYFLRDGRNIGSCNWCAIASDWCLDFWHPPTGLDPAAIIDEIYPTVRELTCPARIDAAHLVDDYLMSRNVARFGLKFTTLLTLLPQVGLEGSNFLWHQYLIDRAEKVQQMRGVLWGSLDKLRCPDDGPLFPAEAKTCPHCGKPGEKDRGWDLPERLLPR